MPLGLCPFAISMSLLHTLGGKVAENYHRRMPIAHTPHGPEWQRLLQIVGENYNICNMASIKLYVVITN